MFTEREMSDVFNQHYEAFVGWAWTFTRDNDKARDVVQTGFLLAWKYRDGFRRRCKLKTWLQACIRNAARDLRRRERVRANLNFPYGEENFRAVDPTEDPEVQAMHAERRRLAELAISRIPQTSRREEIEAVLRGEIVNTGTHRLRRFRGTREARRIFERLAA